MESPPVDQIKQLDYHRTIIDLLIKDKYGFNKPEEEVDKELLILAQKKYIDALLSLIGGEADGV